MTRAAAALVLSACWTASVAPVHQAPAIDVRPVQEVVVADAASAYAMVIDATSLYWVGGEGVEEGIWRADKRAGARPVRLAKTVDARGLTQDGDRLWWGDGTAVRWVKKAGGEVTTALSALPVTVYDMTRDRGDIVVMSEDAATDRIRITRYAVSDGSEGATVELLGSSPITFAQDEGLYVGTSSQFVRVRRDGTVDVVFEGDGDVQTMFFAKEMILFASGGRVYRASKAGGRGREIAKTPGMVTDVGVDDRYIYWGSSLESPGGAIYRMPRGGGTPRVFVRLDGEPSSVIVDGDYLYWADTLQGTIMRRRRTAP
ncbi:MAG: hypothetical protein ABI867_19830 [Kofleriaceae bacterium]